MATVRCGLDRIEEYDSLFAGKRIGLLTIPAAINSSFENAIEVFHRRYQLTAIFSPEHGARGELQAGLPVDTYVDSHTGITVHSIYGKDTHRMTAEQAGHFDILVYDAQDVGSRFYTYLANLKECMELCAQLKKPVVVLDRPNPIGDKVEGNIPSEEYLSLVCAHTMPQRYGLTCGELAQMFNGERKIGCELYVVPMEGYRRGMSWEETGLAYVNASPNLPNLDGIFLYNGTCYFEGTTISEGRGTTRPFELIGAPWLDPFKLAERMNSMGLQGVRFRPTYFTPTFQKHKDTVCGGVQIHVTDREALQAVEVGLRLFAEIRKMSEGHDFWREAREGRPLQMDALAGCPDLRADNLDADMLLEKWAAQAESFLQATEKYRIYQ